MKTAYYPCKYGTIKMQYEKDMLYALAITKTQTEKNEPTQFTDKVFQEIEAYFSKKRKTFDIPYTFIGTPFQKKIWKELEKIPYGETRTYAEIAKNIGNPKACRAVGGACNKNPIWLIVPCHRVVGKKQSLTGYAYGIEMKQELLAIEKSW